MALRGSRESAANGRPTEADLAAIERQHAEQLARAHAALAAAQDRSYWLDRWGLDLNALMRRPGVRRLRALLRWAREARRAQVSLLRYAKARRGDLRATAEEDELAAAAERSRGDRPAAGGEAGAP